MVVGVDLSGHPAIRAQAEAWLPALTLARQSGMLVILHAAELPHHAETRQVW